MDPRDLPPTISIEQAGQLLGISRRSAYRAAASGQIPALQLGKRYFVPTARLLALLGIPFETAATKLEPPKAHA